MNKSHQVSTLFAALVKAQSEFPEVPKTKEVIVSTQKGNYVFKYAPLEKMIQIIRPILHANGLGFTQGAENDRLVTTIFHTSGEWCEHSMPLTDNPSAQQYGSQFTYRRRYSLKAALGIETDDDDADSQYTDDGKKRKATPMAGVMDNIPKERHEYINRVAGSIIDYFNAGNQEEAFKIYTEVTDNEEQMGVWSFLDSKMRRAIKKIGEAKKQEKSLG